MLLCDFHREHAWERWVSKNAHGVVAYKDEVLAKLRAVAHSSTTMEYETAFAALAEWHVWKNNISLRNWFQETWLAEREVSFCV